MECVTQTPVDIPVIRMIKLIAPELRSRLRSGVAVSSVAQCVEELVLNSVDAGALCVAVRIDLPCFKVQVVDNGCGLTEEQLHIIGQRYVQIILPVSYNFYNYSYCMENKVLSSCILHTIF